MEKEYYIKVNDWTKVPVTEEIYRAYRRQQWKEAKRRKIRADMECSYELMVESGIDGKCAYCQAYSRWKAAEEFISKHGYVVRTPSGYFQQIPHVSIAQTYMKIMQKFCEEFGMTPASRSRISGNEEPMDSQP